VLEILLLIGLCKWMGSIMRAKGRKPLIFQIGIVAGWFGGAIIGGFAAGVRQALLNPNQEPDMWAMYPFILVGGVACVSLVFAVAFILPAVQETPQYYANANPYSQPIDPNNPYQSP
jgi:hypothetical protein